MSESYLSFRNLLRDYERMLENGTLHTMEADLLTTEGALETLQVREASRVAKKVQRTARPAEAVSVSNP